MRIRLTEPAREATRQGAELLVNLTYDTWFGRSAAPYQHHLIAAFRAIENRRFLIRSTYTGYTAVVNPLGKTIANIPCFTEGKLTVNVPLLKGQSIYTAYIGETPWWVLVALCACAMVVQRQRRNRNRRFGPVTAPTVVDRSLHHAAEGQRGPGKGIKSDDVTKSENEGKSRPRTAHRTRWLTYRPSEFSVRKEQHPHGRRPLTDRAEDENCDKGHDECARRVSGEGRREHSDRRDQRGNKSDVKARHHYSQRMKRSQQYAGRPQDQ